MFDDSEYRAVILGALLHDIGKLLQRGAFDPIDIRGQHPKVSADFVSAFHDFFGQWVDADLLKTLVQRHHENSWHFPPDLLAQEASDPHQRALALLISKADNLSSSERGRAHDQHQDFRRVPLATIFRALEVNDSVHSVTANLHAAVVSDPTSLSHAFPEPFDGYVGQELSDVIRSFGHEFARMRDGVTGSFETMLSHLVNLLYRFAWCIPANTQEDSPDVSLYDHLRTSCTIAACLYQRHKDSPDLEAAIRKSGEPDFLLVAGDVSGIQTYIFDIARVGAGGVARRLRARSLMVQLYTETAARTILGRLGLPQVCQIMASGGNFYILLPNTSEAEAVLRRLSEEIDSWSMSELHGELALNLAWIPLDEKGFKAGVAGFGRALAQVNTRLATQKRRRFGDRLADVSGWDESSFVLDVHYRGQEACPSCRKFPRLEGDADGLCNWCRRDREIGARLPDATFLQLRRASGLPMTLPGWSADAGRGFQALGDGDVAIRFNDFNLSDLFRRQASARFLATHVPYKEANGGRAPLTFEEIADQATGRPMLGFLKMDVDNLGKLIIFGLKRSDGSGDRDTVSRLMTLSRSLDMFFSGWVQHLLEQDFPTCYTVFSGGDDLFVVGPWDKAFELAIAVERDFKRWTGREDITISAGIVMTQSRYPLSRAAADVEEALRRSKDGGKDRITVLGETRTWADWERAWVRAKGFMGELDRVPTSALYHLVAYGDMWRRWRDERDPLMLRYQPLLAYAVAREGLGQSPRLAAWAEELLEIKPTTTERAAELDDMALVGRLLIYAKRGGRHDH